MKQLIQNPSTQQEMNAGIQRVANIVRCTLGPYGRNVAIMNTRDESSQPLLTDDGVRVVEFALSTLTATELLGAKVVYNSSKRTEEEVGDGTTSTYLLAASIIDEYMVHQQALDYVNPILVRRGMGKAKELILQYLAKVVQKEASAEVLTNIAVSSSGSEEIGKIVGELRSRLGPDGLVNIRQSRNNTDIVNYSKGYEFTGGFVNQELFSIKPIECYDPIVLLIDKNITTTDDAVALVNSYPAILKTYNVSHGTPVVVLCNKFEGDALKVIYHNWFLRTDKVTLPIIPVEVPITGDHAGTFSDLAAVTGASLIAAQTNKLDIAELVRSVGRVLSIKTGKKMTYIVAADDEQTTNRIASVIADLKAQQETLTGIDTNPEYANIAVRISKLNGVAVTIEVGAQTDIERNERKLKYDDAVLATHAASREGVVIGGGYTYFKCKHWILATYKKMIADLKKNNPSEYLGFILLVNALQVPFDQIPMNSGVANYKELLVEALAAAKIDHEKLEEIILYINLDTMKLEILDKADCKVYDPYLVAKSVIENAVSAASLFISTENAVLVEFKQ